MSLDERMARARDDYRALPVTEPDGEMPFDPTATRPTTADGPAPRRWLVAAAVLAVAGLAGALAVIGLTDARDGDTEIVDQPTTTTEPDDGEPQTTDPTTTDPDDVVANVTLTPGGPYRDGQAVTLTFTADGPVDLLNEGVALCAEVATADGPVESCGHTRGTLDSRPEADGRSTVVNVRRALFTPAGDRDCAEPEVTCRLVVTEEDGTRLVSPRLTFTGERPEVVTTATVEPGDEPGTFTLRPSGLEPHPSWLDLRVEHPEEVEGADAYPAFGVRVCSFAATAPPTTVFGEDLWPEVTGGEGACLARTDRAEIDPDEADDPVAVAVPTLLHGYGGWADCRIDRCYLEIVRSTVSSVAADGSLSGAQETVSRVLLPTGGPWAEPVRPTLTIDTPGPHRPGEVTVTVDGLPDGVEEAGIQVGVCRVADPFGCSYHQSGSGLGEGTRTITLVEGQLSGCGPEECFLALETGAKGVAPLAAAPLDTPG